MKYFTLGKGIRNFLLQVHEFSRFDDAIFTLLRTILGDFDFHAIERADSFLGPLFFLAYVFFVFFVLLVSFVHYSKSINNNQNTSHGTVSLMSL